MNRKKTVLFRLCAGCDTPLGLALVPWAGAHFDSSHTLCETCDRQIDAALARNRADLSAFDPAAPRSAA